MAKRMTAYLFIDPCFTRLQGHPVEETILSSPQSGPIFENLVISEALKTKDHFKRPWTLSYWRTKEKEEIDLIVESGQRRLLVEAKLAVQNTAPIRLTTSLKKVFGNKFQGCVVTPSGTYEKLDNATVRVPITKFAEHLLNVLG